MPGSVKTTIITATATIATTNENTDRPGAATPTGSRHVGFFSRVNYRLLAGPKIIFFSVGALYYVFYSYRMDFIKNYLGLPEHLAGLLQAVMQFASFFGVTGWSNWADYRGIHKRLLVGLCLGMAAVFQLLLLAPLLPLAGLLTLAIIVLALFGLVMGGVMPLADYQILKLLKDHFRVDPQLYGRQVLWGTVASGLTTFIIGKLIDILSIKAKVIFIALPVIASVTALAVIFFGHSDRLETLGSTDVGSAVDTGQSEARVELGGAQDETFVVEKDAISTHSTPIETYLATMLQLRFLLFLLMVLSIGIGRQVATTFIPYYLSEEVGLEKGQYGGAYLGSSLLTILLLYCGPFLLQRLSGHAMLMVGLGAMTLRLAAYALLRPSPTCRWQVMAIEMLGSTSFAFTHPAGVREAAACAPPGWEAAFQAAYTCAYVQFPAIFGSILGGFIYRRYRGAALMRVTALFSAFSFVLILLLLAARKLISSKERTVSIKRRLTSSTGQGGRP